MVPVANPVARSVTRTPIRRSANREPGAVLVDGAESCCSEDSRRLVLGDLERLAFGFLVAGFIGRSMVG
jgi:hypothetical protein